MSVDRTYTVFRFVLIFQKWILSSSFLPADDDELKVKVVYIAPSTVLTQRKQQPRAATTQTMDCMCCADGGAGPTTDEEFLGSICHLYLKDGSKAKFPIEHDRYVLYVAAGCPFAARPWVIQAIYGLPIQIVKLFPATEDGGWFFEPQSDGEKALARKIPSDNVDKDPYGHHHLEQLYLKANPNFTGVISVPLLWDKVSNTAVSNSSLGLSKMFYEQFMPSLATRNHHIQLFPPPDDEGASSEHSELVGFIHDKITTKVYKITASKDSTSHDTMVEEYYESLSEMERRLKCNDEKQKRQETSTKTLAYLMGDKVRFADIVLWISLIRLDLCYQFRFGLGKCNVREDYPRLKQFMEQVMAIEGVPESVIPRDIMAQYYMSLKWTEGRSLPLVPQAWEKCLFGATTCGN